MTRGGARRRVGQAGEDLAAAMLEQHGYAIVERNARGLGEIDIIAYDGDVLVFVEVRARKRGALVDAQASLDARKTARMWRAATSYLAGWASPPPCRFDAVVLVHDGVSMEATLLKDVLRASV